MPFKNPFKGLGNDLKHAASGVVSSITENGLKMPGADTQASAGSSSAPAAGAKQSPSLPSVGAPSTLPDAGSSSLESILSSLLLKSTQPLLQQVDTDVNGKIAAVEHTIIFAAIGAAAGALLYERNRIAAALAGFAAGIYFGQA